MKITKRDRLIAIDILTRPESVSELTKEELTADIRMILIREPMTEGVDELVLSVQKKINNIRGVQNEN